MSTTDNNTNNESTGSPSDLIEGGTIEPVADVDFVQRQHRETTASIIAISLVAILAGSALLHYISLLILEIRYGKENTAEQLSQFFNSWLPIISGLVGSAITYYFTKGRQ